MNLGLVKARLPEEEAVFSSIHPAPAYEVASDHLRRAIALGRFLPGDKLPPERELATQMGVSRTTIREAIRVLEGEGLIKVKRGATGGLVVLKPIKLKPSEMGVYLKDQLALLDDILDFRLANESYAAKLAAERRTDAQVERLEELLDNMTALFAQENKRGDIPLISKFMALDAEYHLVIAEAANSELISQAIIDARAAMFLPIGRVFVRLEEESHAHHEEIFRAIKNKNAERAAAAMTMHIEATRHSLHKFVPATI